MGFISDQLIQWHKTSGRHNLPWQNTDNPYLIWLSEIMLQQTQVITVLSYFEKFIKRFPSIDALANAEIAPAVERPIPGKVKSVSNDDGNLPS